MLQKFLFIGTGGSGGATLRYLYREIDSRLRAAGRHEGVPEAFQFLHIDLPHTPGGVDASDVPASVTSKVKYLGLGTWPNEFPHYDQRLIGKPDAAKRLYAEFRPDPSLQYPSPYHGAGQIRLVGRIVSLAGLASVQSAIIEAADRMMTQTAVEQLARLSQTVDSAAIEHNQPARVMLFSSIAGGSGSGIFLDVTECLRANANGRYTWLAKASVALFAPDVFGAGQGQGIAPNSLAALSELVGSVDHLEGSTQGESSLASHGPTPVSGRRGPDYTFLIGNATLDGGGFTRPSQVFQAAASGFAAIVLDGSQDGLLDRFENFVLANWQSEGAKTPLVLRRSNNQGIAKGMGRSSVSLGRRLFAQYAAERLARESLETLRNGHRMVAKESERSRPDEELIATVAERELDDSFREACGFKDTRGDNTSVTDVLLHSTVRRERSQTRMNDLVARLRDEEPTRMSPDEWRDSFLEHVNVERIAALGEDEGIRSAAAVEWIRKTQADIVEATASVIGKIGLPATAKLLEGLEREVRDAVKHSLKQSDELLRNKEPQWASAIASVFDNLRARTIGPDMESFTEAADNVAKSLYYRSLAGTHAMAAQLMQSLVDDLLPQLNRAVDVALATLNGNLEEDTVKQMVSQWPVHDVAAHLRPSPTEVLVDPYTTWPASLDSLLEKQFSEMVEQAMKRVTSEILSGAFPHAGDPSHVQQNLITQSSAWWPEPASMRPMGTPPSQAEFRVALKAPQLLDRAVEWVNDRTAGPIQLRVAEQLRDYLNPANPDAGQRAQGVVTALRAAVPLGRPLVSESASAMSAFYDGATSMDVTFQLTKIPATADMADDVLRILTQSGVVKDGDDGQALLDPNAKGDTIEILSFHSLAVEPWTFASVTGPIMNAYPMNNQFTGDFWIHRRARHLEGFIALSPAHQVALARGIITAGLLGDVDFGRDDLSVQTIWSPDGVKAFPSPLLTAPTHRFDVPGCLLESVVLAFCRAGSGSIQELKAYERLFELGMSTAWNGNWQALSTAAIKGYSSLNPELRLWVETGGRVAAKVGNDVAVPKPNVEGADVAARTAELAARLEASVKRYRQWADQEVGDQTFELPMRNQAASLMLRAAEQIHERVSAGDSHEDDDPIV